LAIRELLAAGFKLTPNSESSETAFEKVSEISQELGFYEGTGEESLRKIWRRHKDHVLAVVGAGPFYYQEKPGPLPINYPPPRSDRPRKR
jgi:hypothetical protein